MSFAWDPTVSQHYTGRGDLVLKGSTFDKNNGCDFSMSGSATTTTLTLSINKKDDEYETGFYWAKPFAGETALGTKINVYSGILDIRYDGAPADRVVGQLSTQNAGFNEVVYVNVAENSTLKFTNLILGSPDSNLSGWTVMGRLIMQDCEFPSFVVFNLLDSGSWEINNYAAYFSGSFNIDSKPKNTEYSLLVNTKNMYVSDGGEGTIGYLRATGTSKVKINLLDGTNSSIDASRLEVMDRAELQIESNDTTGNGLRVHGTTPTFVIYQGSATMILGGNGCSLITFYDSGSGIPNYEGIFDFKTQKTGDNTGKIIMKSLGGLNAAIVRNGGYVTVNLKPAVHDVDFTVTQILNTRDYSIQLKNK